MFKNTLVVAVAITCLSGALQARSLREALRHPSDPLRRRTISISLDVIHANVTKLNLAGRGITKITQQEGNALAVSYPDLEELDLSLNRLKTLPVDVFGWFKNLRVLNLSNNRLKKVNNWGFGGMSNLQELNLAGNFIRRSLREALLYHQSGPLDQMHDTVRQLNLHQAELVSISEEEGQLLTKNYPNLLVLNLSLNHLSTLPEGVLRRFRNLQVLHLSFNKLKDLPYGTFNGLTRLEELLLTGNELTMLPGGMFGGMSGLISLRKLRLGSNKFSKEYIAKIKQALPGVTIIGADKPKVYLGEPA